MPFDVSVPDAPKSLVRQRSRFLLHRGMFLLLLAALAAIIWVPPAWQATERREAYLPQLAAMARRDGTDGPLLALLGGRQMQAGELAAAGDSLARAVAAGEKTEPVWLCLAASKAAVNDPGASAYLRVAAQESDTPGIVQAQARVAMLGPNAHGIALARAICPQGPQPLVDAYARGSFLNGVVAWWGRHHPAQSGFATREEWARQEPENAQAQRLWGLALLENDRVAEASAVLEHAAMLAPQSPDVQLALGQLSEREDEPGQAALQYVGCLRVHPNWLPALMGLGRALADAHLFATAARVDTEAVRLDPHSVDVWIALGQAEAASYEYGSSLQAFQTAQRLAPRRTGYFPVYAQSLAANGRSSDAEHLLQQRLAAVPGDLTSLSTLASIQMTWQPTPAHLHEAEAEMQEVLRSEPQSLPAMQQMADILLKEGRPQAALRWLKQIIAQVPNDVPALLSLSHAYQGVGLVAQAEQVAQKAMAQTKINQEIDHWTSREALAPGDITVHQHLAVAYAQEDQQDKANQERQVVALLRANPSLRGQATQTLQDMVNTVLPPSH